VTAAAFAQQAALAAGNVSPPRRRAAAGLDTSGAATDLRQRESAKCFIVLKRKLCARICAQERSELA
jgi:hypothetical protein